jgi:hypothetical protein
MHASSVEFDEEQQVTTPDRIFGTHRVRDA